MDTTSASLLERLREPGDRVAWERFVQLYTPLLFHHARHVGLSESDAADLVQEVFALLVRKLPQFRYDGKRKFRAWLRTVTINKYRERLRRASGHAMLTVDEVPDIADPTATDPFWEHEYRQHLLARALEIMRTEFADTSWRACWETVVNGRATAEVAAEFGLTPGAVRSARFRILARLRQELAGMLD